MAEDGGNKKSSVEGDDQSLLEPTARRYVGRMKIRSGSYAILMALHLFSDENGGILTKDEIVERGQQFCDNPLVDKSSPLINEAFASWHTGIRQLEDRHNLVERTRRSDGIHQFNLNKRGKQFVATLLQERADDIVASSPESSSKSHLHHVEKKGDHAVDSSQQKKPGKPGPDVAEAQAIIKDRCLSSKSKMNVKNSHQPPSSKAASSSSPKRQRTMDDFFHPVTPSPAKRGRSEK